MLAFAAKKIQKSNPNNATSPRDSGPQGTKMNGLDVGFGFDVGLLSPALWWGTWLTQAEYRMRMSPFKFNKMEADLFHHFWDEAGRSLLRVFLTLRISYTLARMSEKEVIALFPNPSMYLQNTYEQLCMVIFQAVLFSLSPISFSKWFSLLYVQSIEPKPMEEKNPLGSDFSVNIWSMSICKWKHAR